MSSRVYIGHLNPKAGERDVEHFFRGYGKIRDVVLKNGFGFVEFDDTRDAEDAVYELNGKELLGERVIVELSRRGPRGPGGYGGGGGGGGSYGGRGFGGGGGGGPVGGRNRYGPPVQTRYRLLIENLSTRCSWQDLKDLMRNAGEVTYADAHKKERNTALVCFASHSDLKRALDRYQGKDINGRRIKLIDDTEGGRSSRSRSRSPRSRSPRSRSRSKSRSRSPAANGRAASRSRSRSHSAHSRRSGSYN